jgi:hypothetical protein
MKCHCQTGFLSPEPCSQPAAGACGLCGQPICLMHSVAGANGSACPACAATNSGYATTEDTEIESSRNAYFRQYGQAGYFSPQDRAAMDPKRAERYDEWET